MRLGRDLLLKFVDAHVLKSHPLGERAGFGLEASKFGAVLDGHEKEHRDAHEEHEVERNGNSEEPRRPGQGVRKYPNDERKSAGDQPPHSVTLSQPSPTQHLDHHSKSDESGYDAENVGGHRHATTPFSCRGTGGRKRAKSRASTARARYAAALTG